MNETSQLLTGNLSRIAPRFQPTSGTQPQQARLSSRFVEQRMRRFLDLLPPLPRPATMLDLGGTTDFWREWKPGGVNLTVLNIFPQARQEDIGVVVGDACDLSQYPDQSFDVIFSNSVIGHVGSWERQQRMAREIRRVAKRYYLQTPNQDFPVDWRTLVPFFHWLSPRAQAWFFERVSVGRYPRAKTAAEAWELAIRVRNLNRHELQHCFPEGHIAEERVGGFVKSFVVQHGFK